MPITLDIPKSLAYIRNNQHKAELLIETYHQSTIPFPGATPVELIYICLINNSLPSPESLRAWLRMGKWQWRSNSLAERAIRRQCLLNNVNIRYFKFNTLALGETPYPFTMDISLTERQIQWLLKHTLKRDELIERLNQAGLLTPYLKSTEVDV